MPYGIPRSEEERRIRHKVIYGTNLPKFRRGKNRIEIISPEFEIDVKPTERGALVRIIDVAKGKIIESKNFVLKTKEIMDKLREKLEEIV